MEANLVVRSLGLQDYETTWQRMKEFTAARDETTPDEIWWLEHPPVFTLGQAGKPGHILAPADIPVVKTDRGGQVTYHGPGQLVGYLMVDLRRQGMGARDLVTAIETAIMALLASHGIDAAARPDAPGVYVDTRKVAALGLRIRRGCSYHGLALNVDMDLEPFCRINPCGYEGLEVTDLARLGLDLPVAAAAQELTGKLTAQFRYHAQNVSRVTDGQQEPDDTR